MAAPTLPPLNVGLLNFDLISTYTKKIIKTNKKDNFSTTFPMTIFYSFFDIFYKKQIVDKNFLVDASLLVFSLHAINISLYFNKNVAFSKSSLFSIISSSH